MSPMVTYLTLDGLSDAPKKGLLDFDRTAAKISSSGQVWVKTLSRRRPTNPVAPVTNIRRIPGEGKLDDEVEKEELVKLLSEYG